MNRHVLTGSLLLVLASCPLRGPIRADQPDAFELQSQVPAESSLPTGLPTYRRVFVDAQRIADLTARGRRYLPVTREEFDRLIDTAWNAGAALGQSGPRIETAVYIARLTDDSFLRGTAELTVEYGGDGERLMDLAPSSFHLSNIVWLTDDGERRPAQCGAFGVGDGSPPLRQAVLVSHAGTLAFTWAAGSQSGPGDRRFELRFPPCRSKRLVLNLPTGLMPEVERGYVLSTTFAEEGRTEFEIAMGGANETVLRLVNPQAQKSTPAEIFVRQSARYTIDQRGVELSCQIHAPPPLVRPARLWINCDPRIRVSMVSINGTPAEWTRQAESSAEVRRIGILLPEEMPRPEDGAAQSNRAIAIEVHGLTEGVFDRPWRLPAVGVDGAVVDRSRVSIDVAASLKVRRLEAVDAVQVTPPNELAQQGFERFAFEERSPQATIEFLLSRQVPERRLRSASVVTIGEGELVASCVLDFEIDDGAESIAALELGDGWMVETVESFPRGNVRDWSVQRDARSRRLTVQFREPLTPTRAVRTIVTGRRFIATSSRDVRADDLRLVALPERTAGQERLFVRSAPSQGLRFSTGADRPVSIPSDDTERMELLGVSAESTLFAVPPNDVSSVRLEKRGPTFAATVRNTAVVDRGTISQMLDIECTPQGAALAELLVDVRGDTAADLLWQLAGADGWLTVKREDAAKVAKARRRTSRWRLRLPSPQSTPFQVQAISKKPLGDGCQLLLAFVPDATEQLARVEIRGMPVAAYTVTAAGVTRLPSPVDQQDAIPSHCGTFAYDSARSIEANTRVSIRVEPRPDSADFPRAWVRRGELQTVVSAGGTIHHTAALHLENTGLRRMSLGLPEAVTLQEVAVDGRRLSVGPFHERPGEFDIDLPTDRRRPVVRITYTTDGPQLGLRQAVRSLRPVASIPVLGWEWTLRLPPGYAAPPRFLDPCSTALRAARDQSETRSLSDGSEPRPTSSGWTECRGEVTSPIVIVHRPHLVGLAVFAFLASATLTAGALVRRFVLSAVFGCLAGGAALLLPWPYGPIATGTLLGAVSVWVGQSLAYVLHFISRAVRLRPAAVSALAVCAGCWAASGSRCAVAEPESQPAESKPGVIQASGATESPHEVVIPVDADRQPVGDKVFISDRFYSELLQTTKRTAGPPTDWMLRRARYRGGLAESSTAAVPPEWTLTMDLETFHRNAIVRLPISKTDATWNDSAALDGSLIPLNWSPKGDACQIRIAEPGTYRCTVQFVPVVASDGAESMIDVRIPCVADSAVTIVGNDRTLSARRPTVDGVIETLARADGLQTVLENVGRLRIRWLAGTLEPESSRLTVQRLFWLRVAPGAVSMDALFQVQPAGRPVEQLILVIPEELQYVDRRSNVEVARLEKLATDPQRLLVRFAKPQTEPFDVIMQFAVPGADGVGGFRPALVDVASATRSPVQLGATIDPRLEFEPPAAVSVRDIEPEQFSARWPAATSPPQYAYEMPSTREVRIATWPRPAATRAHESHAFTFTEDDIEVEFAADVDLQDGDRFQHRLTVPEAIRVESVRVLVDENAVRAKWTRDEEGHVHILLSRPVSTRHRVVLTGRFVGGQSKRIHLPVVRLVAEDYEPAELVLRRRDTVNVAVVEANGAEPYGETERENTSGAALRTTDATTKYRYDSLQGFSMVVAQQVTTPDRRPGRDDDPPTGDVDEEPSVRKPRSEPNFESPLDAGDTRHNAENGSLSGPTVPQTDIVATIGERIVLTAEFLLSRGDATDLEIELPDGWRLLHVDASGVPSAVSVVSKRRWRVPVDAFESIQPIRLIYDKRQPSHATTRAVTLVMPRVSCGGEAVAVLPMRWEVHPPAGTFIDRIESASALGDEVSKSDRVMRFTTGGDRTIIRVQLRALGTSLVQRFSVASLLVLAVCGLAPVVRRRPPAES